MSNFADDDVLLNTGISFPIAFHDARIRGSEVKMDVPAWRAFSASVSYSHMVGTGSLPISGGLLLGDDVSSQLSSTDRFPISQDQRHTARARVTYDVSTRASLSLAGSYGSGLPVEFDGDVQQAIAQYGPRIVERVDLGHRARPAAQLCRSTAGRILDFSRAGQSECCLSSASVARRSPQAAAKSQ